MYSNTNGILLQLQDKWRNKEFDPTGNISILGASFVANKDHILKEPNHEYIKAEIEWYKSQSLSVKDLFEIYGKKVKIWDAIKDREGFINSNYGWCIWSEENQLQYNMAYTELYTNPKSRRAVMIYNRPTMHNDFWNTGGDDFICTNAVHYYIVDGILRCVVQMRSNDAVFGYNNDYAWQRHVLFTLARDLYVKPGRIFWQVANFHVYPRHFHLIEESLNNDQIK